VQLPLHLPQPRGKVRRRLAVGQQVRPVLLGQRPVCKGAEACGVVSGVPQKARELFQLLRLKGQDGERRLRCRRRGAGPGAEALAQGVVGGKAQPPEALAQLLRRAYRRLEGPRGLVARREADLF
jgi:hypothetical protein